MRIFLSYSQPDESFAKKLKKDLSMQGMDIWSADDVLQPGDLITSKIIGKINEADAFIMILSRKSTGSRWLSDELIMAISAQLKGVLRAIIPVVIEKGTKIPSLLIDREYIDFSDPAGYPKAFQSLISSLKYFSEKTHEQVKKDVKNQWEYVFSSRITLEAEERAFQEKRLARNYRFASLIVMLMGVIGFMSIGMIGIIFGGNLLKSWFLAAMILYLGLAIIAIIWMVTRWQRLKRRHQGHKDE